ncbi:MAG: alpha-amylase family glycosyl hydrolase [Defluviitaleaceae bacterium]|nr:alpha-amylase family glycosyl hydrolase [Defluviitaleaceae bacterium]
MKKYIFLAFMLPIVFILASCGRNNTAHEDFGTPIQGGTILHAFSWSFNTIADYMPLIAQAGFTAVQTSPIQESITRSASAPGRPYGNNLYGDGAWWLHYQPVSFRIGNFHLGTEEEFINMTRIAREHDVKIIVDAVLNHMTMYSRLVCPEFVNLPGGGVRPRMAFGPTRLEQTQGRLLGLIDINTHNPYVQQHILEFLVRCIELGASGFRYDAIFCIERPNEDDPELSSDFWPIVLANGAEFQYGEILGVTEANEYVPLMPVTDAEYGRVLVAALRARELEASNLQRYRVDADPSRLVTWVESHDTFGNYGETADLTGMQIKYGWAIIGAREGSTPLFFNRPMGSMPGRGTRWGNNIVGERGNDDFFAPEVAAVNHFKNAMRGTAEHFSNPAASLELLMIERGGNGVVIANMGAEVILNNVNAYLLADGTYTDRISGNVFIVEGGMLSGVVPAESVVVFWKDA